MPRYPKVQFRLVSRKKGLRTLERRLPSELKTGLLAAGKRLSRASRSYMREDTGEAKRKLRSVVRGTGMTLTLNVFSNMIQAYVDAYGLKRGTFPNFRVGGNLYNWVRRKMNRGFTEVERTNVPKTNRRNEVRRLFLIRVPKVRKLSNTGMALPKPSRAIRRRTYFVARAIYRHGISASHWNRKALDQQRANIKNDVRNAVRRAINIAN